MHTNFGGKQGTDCIECHQHTGFGHGGAGGCDECHGHDEGYGGATGGKGTYASHSTHTENDADDLKGPNIACSVCHDTNNFPYFKTGTDGNGDGRYSLAETDVCDTCHSPGGTYDGVDNLTVGAKNNWSSSGSSTSPIYAADGSLQSGKEKWCATCHDEVPSVINAMIAGSDPAAYTDVSAPNVVGDEDGSYIYGTGWGYYKTGHGLPGAETYPSKGGIETLSGRPVECDSCHDYSTAHIDGNARTFNDGDLTGDDTVDPSFYRIGYRLNLVTAGEGTGATTREPILAPRPPAPDTDNVINNARLCFDCHPSAPFLVYSNRDTNFATDEDIEHNILSNLHETHLDPFIANEHYPADWDGSYTSEITCMACHNVHGSTNLAMVRDGKLVGREPGQQIWYKNDAITTYPYQNPPSPEDVPLAASHGTVWLPESSANLCYSSCHGTGIQGEDRTPYQDVSQAPTLAWTGEANYLSDGVNPDSGPNGGSFTFRVEYKDTNNDAPTSIQVWVDKNDDGDYLDVNEKVDMTAVDGGDTNYTDGKLYYRTEALIYAGDGNLNYRFYASDGALATGPPTNDNSVIVLNENPALSWTGETYFVDRGVNPDTGPNGSDFEFRITYTDPDPGHACPVSGSSDIQVWIDEDDVDGYEADEKHNLLEDSAGDTDCTDGKIYKETRALSTEGTHNYRFYATDGVEDALGAPTSNSSVTVMAIASNPPSLEWVTAACLAQGVRPQTGDIGADFEFLIKYTDIDAECPTIIQVWVDANDDSVEDAGEFHDLTEVDPDDTDCSDGKVYSATVQVSSIEDDGIIDYHFLASDGTNDAVGDPVSNNTITVVDALKVRPSGGDGWYSAIQTAVTETGDGNPLTILVYPNEDFTAATYSENVMVGEMFVASMHNRTIQSVCGAELTIISSASSGDAVSFQQSNNGTLDGFQLTGGQSFAGCGAIWADDLSIKNNWIYGNTNGIWLQGAVAAIANNRIYSNTSNGNGILAEDFFGFLTSATITGNEIYENSNNQNSSGIYLKSGGPYTITDTVFRNNSIGINTSSGVGEINITGSEIYENNVGVSLYSGPHTITDTVIRDNTTSAFSGAGIRFYGALAGTTITNTTITGNSASVNANNGGAIYIVDSPDVSFENCTITGNSAVGDYGGAIYIEGSSASFENCIIADNQAAYGGAVYVNSGTTSFINTTFADQAVTHYGGAIYAASGAYTNTVRNSIFWNNTAGVGGNNAYYGGASADFMTVSDSDITTGAGYIDGGTIINDGDNIDPAEDPVFVGGGDYHIQSGSPVIDQANAAYAPAEDIDGDSRPIGAADDMGADEYAPGDNNQPVLEWTGETNYTSDGVNPDSAAGGSSFTFKVTYTDADDEEPSPIQVWVDEDDDGTYEAGEKYAMTVEGGDSDYTNGEDYTKSLTLDYAGDGTIKYTFYSSDGTENASGTPTSDNNLTVINNVPTLAWTGQTDYDGDGVNPNTGANGSSFEFRVKYTDIDNTAPTSIQVWVDEDDLGSYDAGEKYNMTVIGGQDGDYTNGEFYTKTLTLGYGEGNGVLNYRFYSSDGADDATGSPTNNSTVTITNTLPVGGYTADNVIPAAQVTQSGDGDGIITIQFRAKDADTNNVTLKTFEYSVNGGSGWSAPTNNDSSGSLSTNWTDSDGAGTGYTSATDWSGTVHSFTFDTEHADVTGMAGVDQSDVQVRFILNDGQDSAGYVTSESFQVDNAGPTATITSATYNASTDTMVITGTNFTTIATASTDIKSYVDWPKFVWDINGDDAVTANITFVEGDVTSLIVTDAATLTLVFTGSKGTDIEGTTGYGITGGADTLDVTAGFCKDVFGKAATTDAVADGTLDANTFVVNKTGDTKDGTCSASDCSLREAVIAANANPGADTVTVPPGTYTISLDDGDYNVTETITIQGAGQGSTIIAGTDDRVFIDTVASTDLTFNDVTIKNGNPSGYGGCVYAAGVTVTVNDSTFDNCSTTGATDGGAIYADSASSLILDNVTFTNNSARMGGAIKASDLTVNDSTFTGNTAVDGGGAIYVVAAAATFTISGTTTFTSNVNGTTNHGGAIYSKADLDITGSATFNSNSAKNGGAIYMDSTGVLTVDGATFTSNTATSAGGAVNMQGGGTIQNSTFTSNIALGNGGALFSKGATITSSIFDNNYVNNTATAGYGGAIRNIINPLIINGTSSFTNNNTNAAANYKDGGAISANQPITISGSVTISGNKGGNGGGVYGNKAITISGATISGNTATSGGGGVHATSIDGSITLANTTISGNSTTGSGGGIKVNDPSGSCTLTNVTFFGNSATGAADSIQASTCTITNTIITNGAGSNSNCSATFTSGGYNIEDQNNCGFSGTGDMPNTDPLLEALADNGGSTQTHALQTTPSLSPAIDAGDDATCDTSPIDNLDQRGETRTSPCDIGSYEYIE